jgi:hypothetical protein
MPRPNVCKWRWLIDYGFISRSRIFHLYGDVTTAGEGPQHFDLYSALRAFIVPHLLWHGALSSFSGLIQGPALFSRLLGHARECGGSILTRILTKMEYCYIGNESWWWRNWNHPVYHKVDLLVTKPFASNFNNISEYEPDVEHSVVSSSLGYRYIESTYEWNWLKRRYIEMLNWRSKQVIFSAHVEVCQKKECAKNLSLCNE